MKELVWKAIPNFEEYQVSNYGQVKRKNKILSNRISKHNGYARVVLCKDGERYEHKVHRLVATLFLSNLNQLPMVNHKDTNKLNNHVDNLEWCTHQENMDHYNNSGITNYLTGEGHGSSKLYEEEVNHIRQLLIDGKKVRDVAELYGISYQHVCGIRDGKTWRSSPNGAA